MLLTTIILSTMLISSSNSDSPGSDEDDLAHASSGMNALLRTLLANYSKELVPDRPVVVLLNLLMLKVKSTIEREGVFESVIGLFMEWKDPRLIWNAEAYGNVRMLAFDSHNIWIPDVALTNSADHVYSLSKDDKFVVRSMFDGTVNFVPTGTSRTWCELELSHFPFDRQTCFIEFESWSLDSTSLMFNNESQPIIDDAFTSNQWYLCGHSAKVYLHDYGFTFERFARVKFAFTVERKSTFYVINLIFPCTILSLTQLLVFFIPSKNSSTDRVAFGTTNLLTLIVFQTIATAEMPKASDAVPALSKYVVALIVLSAIGITQSIAIQRIVRIQSRLPPRWLLRILEKKIKMKQQAPSTNVQPPEIESLKQVDPSSFRHVATHLYKHESNSFNFNLPQTSREDDGSPDDFSPVWLRQSSVRSQRVRRRKKSGKFVASNEAIWIRIANAFDMAMFAFCCLIAILLPSVLFGDAIIGNICVDRDFATHWKINF